jgi:hypothetical protein
MRRSASLLDPLGAPASRVVPSVNLGTISPVQQLVKVGIGVPNPFRMLEIILEGLDEFAHDCLVLPRLILSLYHVVAPFFLGWRVEV